MGRHGKAPVLFCRSELAREGRQGAAGCQVPSVIVDVHREQARSYRGRGAQRGDILKQNGGPQAAVSC
ncbi:Triphosphoribosyl-dephospho-CoA synthetase [Pseudomonas batumici]|uniref:Triphosphoribosyl-dephospho-CoA synthetase n=1 Tax=Pseudomonas batumici TaxID=226910 RepID=A0A0C2I6X8_9PSED|nr:Triphosphoribosyl-dephospho-CoA synthetase [Pseudomonas batumici]